MNFFHAFLKRINGLIEPADRIVVGVSGGVDSVVLLDLLDRLSDEYALTLIVAHVNHGLRGKESDRDEKFVKELARKKGLPFKLSRQMGNSTNIQSLARDFRHKFFFDTAKKAGANKIALAHHADDQAETIILHLLRGSGLEGLLGMLESTEIGKGTKLIRPLLRFSRAEIEQYARGQGLKFVEDSTNIGKKYTRNIVRHEVLPKLTELNPQAITSICETANLLRDENEVLEKFAEEAFKEAVIKEEKGRITLSRTKFISEHRGLRRRILRLVYKSLIGSTKDLLTDHVERMDQIATSDTPMGRYSLPSHLIFKRDGDVLILKRT